MRSTYPIVLIPPALQQVKTALPPAPPFTAIKPAPPGNPPQKLNIPLLGGEAFAGAVLSTIVATQRGAVESLLVFLVSLVAIADHAWWQAKTYPDRQKVHHQAIETYRQQLKDFQQQQRQHEELVRQSRTPEKVAQFRQKLLEDTLRQTVPNTGSNSAAPQGRSEEAFGEHLLRYFGKDRIRRRLTLGLPGWKCPYTPDFTYLDLQRNLFVDIEIDEPYTGNPPKPIHYIGADDLRDQFFLDSGWLVIRFAEKQVVQNPKGCCKAIAQTIASLLEDDSVTRIFNQLSRELFHDLNFAIGQSICGLILKQSNEIVTVGSRVQDHRCTITA